VREKIAEILTLIHPDFKKTFYIHVDASKKGYGAILTQRSGDPDGGQAEVPQGIPRDHIAFASLALPETHTRYNNSERECYALSWATLKFREFVHGCDTVAFSNHESLTKLAKGMKGSRNGMIMSWLAEIMWLLGSWCTSPGN